MRFHMVQVPLRKWVASNRWASSSVAVSSLRTVIKKDLDGIKAAGTWKKERTITSKQGVSIRVEGNEKKILNFCANNYLGLSSHPEVIKAGLDALKNYGAGLSSVRFICGTQDIHLKLEEKIAQFHQQEAAILYPSCFDANGGLFETFLTVEDGIFSDELNHASIIDGIRLCKAKKFRYKHRNMDDLESILKENSSLRLKLIVSDGVFSMDGNIAPLKKIVDLANKYNALVFLDECHATGIFGKSGRGTEEYCGVSGHVDIINSTLGKALGGAAGGYTTGPAELIHLLRQRSRPYSFSNSVPPPVVACASKAIDLVTSSSEFFDNLNRNTTRFRTRMTDAGFKVIGENHPICPVMLEDAKLASVFADEMLERGIYVIGFSFPVVPKGKARIRVQLSAMHSLEEVDQTIDAFIAVGRKLKVIK